MFTTKHYVPILKWKRAEQGALETLPDKCRDRISPLIELVMPKPKSLYKDKEKKIRKTQEELFQELGYKDKAESACLVIETDSIPPVDVADHVAKMCGISTDKLTLILTPTSSLCGSVQIVARVLETALHKAHTLGFCIAKIVDGAGSALLCPHSNHTITAKSRTKDPILFTRTV